jgi:hypothetical protein
LKQQVINKLKKRQKELGFEANQELQYERLPRPWVWRRKEKKDYNGAEIFPLSSDIMQNCSRAW